MTALGSVALRNTATSAQIDFINLIKDQRQVPADTLDAARSAWRTGEFSVQMAAELIDLMLTLPRERALWVPGPGEMGLCEARAYGRQTGECACCGGRLIKWIDTQAGMHPECEQVY